jgi:cytochrome c oxidase cbb3-type subunit III
VKFLPAILLIAAFTGSALNTAAEADDASAVAVSGLEAGRKIYNFRCYFCHGYSGDAKTVAASFLNPRPVDFTGVTDPKFDEKHIVEVLRNGKPGTAMNSFRTVLSDAEMEELAAFIMDEFVRRKAPNTRYHTPENGWPNHERYKIAFPFATGEIPVDTPWENLTEEQQRGKRLFLDVCVVCHDRGRRDSELILDTSPLSYPRNNYAPGDAPKLDAMASASPYLLHEVAPVVKNMTPLEKRGEKLFQNNCAFCHAKDGTGKNWIGSFLEPHPRNLRDPEFMQTMTRQRLSATIREGLAGTSMPAWKNVLKDREIAAIVAYVSRAFYPLPEK